MQKIEILKWLNFRYLGSTVFIAPMLVRPSKCLEEIVYTKHSGVKNPKWLEANQLAIYKRGRRFELDTTENKSS